MFPSHFVNLEHAMCYGIKELTCVSREHVTAQRHLTHHHSRRLQGSRAWGQNLRAVERHPLAEPPPTNGASPTQVTVEIKQRHTESGI